MKEGGMQLIGIAGGSCSGKSTLIRALEKRFGEQITTLSFDEYFVGTTALGDTAITDWESPALYHYDRFTKDLATLKTGREVEIICNSRESTEQGITSKLVIPRQHTLVEGFLIFHDPTARHQFDTKIFIDVPEEDMIKRRLARSKGRDKWNDPTYINNMLIPGYRKYVLPQRQYATVVIDGLKPVDRLVDEVTIFMK